VPDDPLARSKVAREREIGAGSDAFRVFIGEVGARAQAQGKRHRTSRRTSFNLDPRTAGRLGTARMRALAMRVAVAMAVIGSMVHAADQALPGTKLLVFDPTGDPARRKLSVTATEKGTVATVTASPVAFGAELRVTTEGGTPTAQTFVLPGPGWRQLRTDSFKYSNAVVGGAVKSVIFKVSSSGGVQLKIRARGADGALDIVPPNLGDQAVVTFTVEHSSYCVTFGGAAGGEERRDDAHAWLVQRSAAVPCPSPPPTSSTTTTESSTTTTSTTTTTVTTTTSTTTSSTTSTTTTSTTTLSTTSSTTTTSTTSSTTSTTTITTTTTAAPTTIPTTTTSSTTTSTTTTSTTTTSTTTTSTTTTTGSTTTTAPCNPDSESYSEPAFYRSLAYRWAPIILQDTASKWNADFIGRVDYDNDWRGNDNWDNLPSAGIAPYLYYDVLETSTHWFIHYHTFHPRDWDDVFFGTCGPFSDCHENDTENLFMMIQKDGSTYGRFRVMETEAHTSFYQYALANDGVSNGSGPDADDLDNDAERGFSLFADTSVGVTDPRPAIYIESKGHGICDWWDNNGPYCIHPDDMVGASGNDGVMYYPSATAVPTVPSNPKGGQWYNFKYPYELISMWDDVWVLRSCLGNGMTFDSPFTYPGVSGNGSPYIGGAMDGDDYAADAGTAWWAQAHGNLAPGDWTMDPASTVLRQLTFAETVDRNYNFNPFLGIR
jgi:hypothetical protein